MEGGWAGGGSLREWRGCWNPCRAQLFKAADILMTAGMGGQGRRRVVLRRRSRCSNAMVGDTVLHPLGQACPLGRGEGDWKVPPLQHGQAGPLAELITRTGPRCQAAGRLCSPGRMAPARGPSLHTYRINRSPVSPCTCRVAGSPYGRGVHVQGVTPHTPGHS